MKTDVTIIGAGPAGLCFARALAGTGLNITLVERQPEQALAEPAFDGREIALTHRSVALMQRLGLWERIPAHDIAPLRDARIFNGRSPKSLHVGARSDDRQPLGHLVPNHRIRAAAYECVRAQPAITLLADTPVAQAQVAADGARLRLADGRELSSRLLVAADSRFSETRRALGIPVRMHDFGKSMLVCRVSHERSHEETAWEWFDHGQTLALLPLGCDEDGQSRSSVVLTLAPQAMREVQALDDDAFAQEIERRFDGRLGRMRPISPRHVYPLVGTYPSRFVGECSALIGDAAIGMHPVTAHGFNFGLLSVERLSNGIAGAAAAGNDIASTSLLQAYDRGLRRDTLPLYLATRGIVGLFTDDRWPAQLLRNVALRSADAFPPFKHLLGRALADDGRHRGVLSRLRTAFAAH